MTFLSLAARLRDERGGRVYLTIFKHHGHRRALVQDAQLALGALLVGGVGEDAAVEQGPVGVGDHAADVAGAVGLAVVALGVLEGVEVGLGVVAPVERVALVDGVDGAAARDGHVGVGEDELAEGVVEREAVDGAALHGDDELGRGAVHGEAGGQQLGARAQDVLLGAARALGQLVHAEDGADGHAGVEVGAAVDGVAGDGVARADAAARGAGLVEEYNVVFLFGDEEGALARGPHRRDEQVVADDVQLLLVVARRVGLARETRQVDERRAPDVVRDGLEGELERVAEESVWVTTAPIPSVRGIGWDGTEEEIVGSFFVLVFFVFFFLTYVKSPVASLCFVCSSVRNRVNVTMLVFTLADSAGGISCDMFGFVGESDGYGTIRCFMLCYTMICWL